MKVATLEPHSLSPSYWKFLQRITGGKMGQAGWGGWGPSSTLLLFIHCIFCKYHQVNRVLVDYEYGTEAAKQVNSKDSSLFFYCTYYDLNLLHLCGFYVRKVRILQILKVIACSGIHLLRCTIYLATGPTQSHQD